jgi:outer membrane lipoprotein-sorting protein
MKRTLSAMVFLAAVAFAMEAQALSAKETMEKSQEAFYYQGEDFRARVVMKLINREGGERVREMTMLRKDYPAGEQKYFIYFFRPVDVRDMAFMVFKHPGRDDERWLFVPAINMVRRIAAEDKKSSFVGSDFTYEDVSGRDVADDSHEFLRQEDVGGRKALLIKSTPKAGDMDYAYRLSWVDAENFLPLKEEYRDGRDELIRTFTADEIREVKGLPTVMKRTMMDARSGHRTEVTFLDADYNTGVKDDLFSERYLRRPPMRWIR